MINDNKIIWRNLRTTPPYKFNMKKMFLLVRQERKNKFLYHSFHIFLFFPPPSPHVLFQFATENNSL